MKKRAESDNLDDFLSCILYLPPLWVVWIVSSTWTGTISTVYNCQGKYESNALWQLLHLVLIVCFCVVLAVFMLYLIRCIRSGLPKKFLYMSITWCFFVGLYILLQITNQLSFLTAASMPERTYEFVADNHRFLIAVSGLIPMLFPYIPILISGILLKSRVIKAFGVSICIASVSILGLNLICLFPFICSFGGICLEILSCIPLHCIGKELRLQINNLK